MVPERRRANGEDLYEVVDGCIDSQKTALGDLLKNLIRLKTENPPGNEREIADYLLDEMLKLGIEAREIEVRPRRSNAIGHIGDTEHIPSLMLNGHTDTVPAGEGWSVDPFNPLERNGRIHGRGAADMKGGIASIVIAVKALVEAGFQFKSGLMLSFVIDEEVSELGMLNLIDQGIRSEMAIIAESSNLEIVSAHKGFMEVQITSKGRMVHGSIPEEGVNAIEKASKLIIMLEELKSKLTKKRHRLLGTPTLSVNMIQGGIQTNVVPNSCKLVIDRRLIPSESFTEAAAEISDVIKLLENQDSDARFELRVSPSGLTDPIDIASSAQIIKSLQDATRKVFGVAKTPIGISGGADSHLLVNRAKIPTVLFGPGDISQAHTADEYVEIDQLTSAAKVYAVVIQDLCG